jgi:hypothetical protein
MFAKIAALPALQRPFLIIDKFHCSGESCFGEIKIEGSSMSSLLSGLMARSGTSAMRIRNIAISSLFILMAVCGAGRAIALTPADQQELQRFTLTEDFLNRYGQAIEDARAHPEEDDSGSKNNIAALTSLDAMTAEIKKSPNAIAHLQKFGLSPREAVVGGIVLMRASMADAAATDPKLAKVVDPSKIPSAANMAFFRAHKTQIEKIMKKDDN